MAVRQRPRDLGTGSRVAFPYVRRTPPAMAALPTEEERQILQWIADGLPSKEMAVHLWIRPHSVDRKVNKLLQRLGARSRSHAVGMGFRLGLLK